MPCAMRAATAASAVVMRVRPSSARSLGGFFNGFFFTIGARALDLYGSVQIGAALSRPLRATTTTRSCETTRRLPLTPIACYRFVGFGRTEPWHDVPLSAVAHAVCATPRPRAASVCCPGSRAALERASVSRPRQAWHADPVPDDRRRGLY